MIKANYYYAKEKKLLIGNSLKGELIMGRALSRLRRENYLKKWEYLLALLNLLGQPESGLNMIFR
jgi:hypothetical protein